MVDSVRTNSSRTFNQADLAFHIALWEASGNEFLEMALKRALMPYFAFGAIRLLSQHTTDLLRDAGLHLAIAEGVRTRDPQVARSVFENALEEWHEACRANLAARDGGVAG
jgi:DNA-binding FadR family transcriptional regulator